MYRTIDCDTWDDPWFASLTPRGKFLFLYFITNRRTSAVGCFEITLRQIEFETGLDQKQIDSALEELASRIVWWPDLQVVFVRNFYKHQAGNSNSENFRKAAIKALLDFPEVVRTAVGDAYPDLMDPSVWDRYGIPMPSPRDGDNKTVTEKKQRGSTRTRAQKSPTSPIPADFKATDEMYAWAASNGLGRKIVDAETAQFIDYHQGKDSRQVDWVATWRTWMRNTHRFGSVLTEADSRRGVPA